MVRRHVWSRNIKNRCSIYIYIYIYIYDISSLRVNIFSDNLFLQLFCYCIAPHSFLTLLTKNGATAQIKYVCFTFDKLFTWLSGLHEYYVLLGWAGLKTDTCRSGSDQQLSPPTPFYSQLLLARCQASRFMHTATSRIAFSCALKSPVWCTALHLCYHLLHQ